MQQFHCPPIEEQIGKTQYAVKYYLVVRNKLKYAMTWINNNNKKKS